MSALLCFLLAAFALDIFWLEWWQIAGMGAAIITATVFGFRVPAYFAWLLPIAGSAIGEFEME